jgi:hypothetical protein
MEGMKNPGSPEPGAAKTRSLDGRANVIILRICERPYLRLLEKSFEM